MKSFLIHGTAVIEAIANFVVISQGHGKTTIWKNNYDWIYYGINQHNKKSF